ncbi:MAG: hypothetical protein AAF211_11155 [Myxococcota bacterium]
MIVWMVALGCSREVGIGQFSQPEPREHADRYVQESAPRSDVLFVVDNSESMEDEQEALATNFPAFLDWFEASEVDYHIGVISTDMDDPQQSGLLRESGGVRWIEPTTPDAATILAEMTRLGIAGSSDERGREAAYTALELRGAANDGFRRDDAFLNIIVVSDEDDQSGDDRISLPEFTDYLQDLQTETLRTTFSAVVGPFSRAEAQACEVTPGFEYLEVTTAVGGVAWSICEADWLPLINDLGFVTIGLRRTFRLTYTPDPTTIEVAVDAEPVSEDAWTHEPDANVVTFLGDPPPTGSEVVIRYITTDEP